MDASMTHVKCVSRRDVLRAAGATGVGALLHASGVTHGEAANAAETSPQAASAPQSEKTAVLTATLREEARDIPVVEECDVCVIGGGCTGVFAAVAAARLGARVCLVENLGYLGGVATASLVNIWHSIYDTAGKRQIIAGLTTELIDRLTPRGAVITHEPSASRHFVFNSAEMAIELDALVAEAKVRSFLHTRFVVPITSEQRVVAAWQGESLAGLNWFSLRNPFLGWAHSQGLAISSP
jgi:hypothetical protein